MSKYSHNQPRARYQHNNALVEQHREMLTDEVLHGVKPVCNIARETGVPEHRIATLAKELGVDLAERRDRIVRMRREEAKQALICKITADMQSDRTVRRLNPTSLARRYRCSVYAIGDALRAIGHKPGNQGDDKMGKKYGGGMAGALSRHWLGRAWS